MGKSLLHVARITQLVPNLQILLGCALDKTSVILTTRSEVVLFRKMFVEINKILPWELIHNKIWMSLFSQENPALMWYRQLIAQVHLLSRSKEVRIFRCNTGNSMIHLLMVVGDYSNSNSSSSRMVSNLLLEVNKDKEVKEIWVDKEEWMIKWVCLLLEEWMEWLLQEET